MASVGIPCNGNGRCLPDFDTKTATCDCMDKFRGVDCGIECPGDIIACNGHGTCDDVGNCTCDTNLAWTLPSCKCSDEFTCNRNGQCNSEEKCECFGNFGGDHCIECKANYFGDNCDLFCNPYSTCNGHGTCLVENNAIKCTCNLHTSRVINVGGASNLYTSYYSQSSNCGECEAGYFPKEAVVAQYGMPAEFQVPCEYECEPSTCNFEAGVCNPQYGAPNTPLCDCVNSNVDPLSMCTECKDGWFPNDKCNKFCIAAGTLPPECDGTKDCVQCSGHGECNLDGQCVCSGGYTGDQCQILCTSANGLICGGHGTCESNDIQLLMEHEFRKEGNVALFSCTCDPQDPVGADARIDWDEKLEEGLVNGTLDPLPDPEYFGETCDYHCLRPPWKDSGECNGLGNCSVMTIRTPTGGFVSCNKDSDCTGSTTITQMLSIDPFWSNKKGPFCHREDDIHGCDKSTDDCYEILLKQRPRKMRNEECVEGSDIITAHGQPSLALAWSECKAYSDATAGLVWSGNTSWTVPPQGCYASPNQWGDDVVYFNTFASGVDCSADKYCIQLSCHDAIENEDWYTYCQNLEDKLQPPLFKDCNSVEPFCPAKTIPTVCKTMVELTDGVDVSAKLNRTYEYDKRQYPFLITAEDYRTPHASLEHDAAEQNFNFFINKWGNNIQYREYIEGQPPTMSSDDCQAYATHIGASFYINLNNPGPGCVVTTDKKDVRYNPGACQHPNNVCECSTSNICIAPLYKLDTTFCSAHSDRYPVIDYARENKQYLCNGVITNDKNCSGFFDESAGTFYKPFEVVCPNSETEFRTYEEALQARGKNCKVVEKIFNNNTADTDGKDDIDLVCKIIDNKFPTCKPATACDFNPCSPNHVCSSDGLMATCTTSGQLNSTCLSGAFVDRPSFDSYRCEITFTDNDDCPTDVSFNTNYPKYCKDNNPVVSYVESIGNSQNVSISMDKYIRFEFKATDAVLTGTRLEFEDAITIYIRQGQIQLNEVSSLQACPVTNINCHDDWAYTPDEWYTLELEITGSSVTMTRKDTGLTLTKSLLSSTPITSVATEPGQSIVQYRYISVEKDIPSPHSCTYAACNLDVNYREICSDIVRNIHYPLTLLPKHDILETCSTLHINSRVVNTFSYEINEDIYNLLDWDLYCGFYDALTPLYLQVTTGEPNLSLNEDECKAFADDHNTYTWVGTSEWTDRPSGCSLYTHSSDPNRIFYNKKQITYACGTSGVWECIQRSTPEYKRVTSGEPDLSLDEDECKAYADSYSELIWFDALEWTDRPSGCSLYTGSSLPNRIFYNKKQITYACGTSGVWECIQRNPSQYTDLETYPQCREFVDPMDGNKICIVNALDHDWVQGCSDIDTALIPDAIEKACPNTCYNHLLSLDRDFCPERDEIFSANKVVKETCSTDWYDYCLKDSKGTLDGKCSAVECNCDTEKYEGISGQSCEIHCPVGFDGSACAEASGMGTCRYTQLQKETLENTVADEDGNKQAFEPQFALEGECECFLSEGTRNCDIECRDCNNNTYGSLYIEVTTGAPDLSVSEEECESYFTGLGYGFTSGAFSNPSGCFLNIYNPDTSKGFYNTNQVTTACSSGIKCIQKNNARGQIGICDTTRGACQCLPPFTGINFYNETDWRGKVIEKNEREYNDGGVSGRDLYRIRQMQGKESFIRNALQVLNVLNSRIVFTTSGTDHFVYNGQNDPDISLCQFYPYTIYHDHNEDMRIVKGEDCDNKGCSDGKWITLPSNFERDFVSTQDTTHTFFKSGTYYYMSTVATDMVGKITVATCTGTPAYTGGEKWEKMYERFLNNPGDFWCFDRRCSGGDVNTLGSLDESSSRYNYDCNSLCPGLDNVTQLSCSKRGRCGVTGQCVCDTASVITGTDDKGVKKIIQIQPGVEIVNTDLTITALDRTGYRGDDCSIICPGYDEDTKDMTTICNGHGTCDLAGECACEVGYIGDECQFKCPSSDGTSLCNGHGTCELAEVNIMIDTYDGTSTQCQTFANVEQCEGYAILNDLPVVDVAGIYEIGENEICARIDVKQCELWSTVQPLSYTYSGEIIDPTKPLGCILDTQTNVIQFNKDTTLANNVKCGIDYNCLCQKTKPDIIYCKINGDNVLIHEMGGDDYTTVTGRWLVDSYIDKIQLKTTTGITDYPLSRLACAKYTCTLGTCTVANPESQFIVDKFENSGTAVGGVRCSGENACAVLCDNDPSCTGYYARDGYESSLASEAGCGSSECSGQQDCENKCSADSSCNGWVSYMVTATFYKTCKVFTCVSSTSSFNQWTGKTTFTCNRYQWLDRSDPSCGFDQYQRYEYGSDFCYSTKYYIDSYKKGNEFYYGSTVYTGSTTIKKMKVSRASEWYNYAELTSSSILPTGCVKLISTSQVIWVHSGNNAAVKNDWDIVEYDLYLSGLKPDCSNDANCLGIQEDPPGTNKWHKIQNSLYIIRGSGSAYGPVPYFSEGYKCSNCDGSIFIPESYSISDATNICSGLARADPNAVAFTVKIEPVSGTYYCCKSTDCRSWVQQDPDYRSYSLFGLISGDKTRRFVKNPENLCILPEASKIEAKSQAPVLKSLRANNDLCKYIITSGTCPMSPTEEDCKRYIGTTNLVNMPGRPGGCYMDGNNYNYNTNTGSGCSATHPCVCKTDTYLDKNSNRCVSFDKEPIIDVRLYLDQGKPYEQTKNIDCQVNSATKITCAQCNCFDSLVYGNWAGFECETCSNGYGKSQCREVCSDYDGENVKTMCGGFGKCLFGSQVSGIERVFQEANCVCGQDDQYQARTQNRDIVATYTFDQPNVLYFYSEMRTNGVLYDQLDDAKEECNKFNDLTMANIGGYCYGIFILDINNLKYELAMGIVGSQFITYYHYYEKSLSASTSTEYEIKTKELSQAIVGTGSHKACKAEIELVLSGVDTCNHFSDQIKSCDQCASGWSGKNCRLKCNKCLFKGECDESPNEKLVSQCSCPSGSGLWGYQCCPSGFMVPDLINWNSISDDKLDQIKLTSMYDVNTNNELDAAFHCKKCPGIADVDWLEPASTHKVCSGASRGTCISNNNVLECECKIHPPSGSTWKGRACSCHDSISTSYSLDIIRQETTDYGCLIPTGGTGVCPEPSTVEGSTFYFVPPKWFYLHARKTLDLRSCDSPTVSGSECLIAYSGDDAIKINIANVGNQQNYVHWLDANFEHEAEANSDSVFIIDTASGARLNAPFSGKVAKDIFVTSANYQGFTGQGPCNTNIPVEVTSGSPDQSASKTQCENYAMSIGYPYYGNSNDGNVMGCFVQHGGAAVYYNEKSTTTTCGEYGSNCVQIKASDCKGTLICYDRQGTGAGREGYNVDAVSETFKFCVEETDSKIGCDPLLKTTGNIWQNLDPDYLTYTCSRLNIPADECALDYFDNQQNYHKLNNFVTTTSYWDGEKFADPDQGYYVPMLADGNGNYIIHRQQFPCPAGKYGPENMFYTYYSNVRICAMCKHSTYQDEEGQTSCKSCPSGTKHSYLGRTSASQCTTCPAGKQQDSIPYDDGTYCKECSSGKYGSGGECLDCPIGKYGNGFGALSCTDCGAGKYTTSVATDYASGCKDCSSGYINPLSADNNYAEYKFEESYLNDGAVSYSQCQGYATSEGLTFGLEWVYNRPTGCYKTGSEIRYNDVSPNVDCSSTYKCITTDNVHNDGTCDQCEAGTFERSHSSPCISCIDGYYSRAGASGTRVSPCLSSYGCGGGSYGCDACSCGRYGSSTSITIYGSMYDACGMCSKGKYSTSGAGSCTNCPSGKTTYSSGTCGTSSSTCFSQYYRL
jgi:hypothetical protein